MLSSEQARNIKPNVDDIEKRILERAKAGFTYLNIIGEAISLKQISMLRLPPYNYKISPGKDRKVFYSDYWVISWDTEENPKKNDYSQQQFTQTSYPKHSG